MLFLCRGIRGCAAFWAVCELSCFFIAHLSTSVLVYKIIMWHVFFSPLIVRWDDSLMELLDIFSPVSNPERCQINPSSRKSFVAPRSSQKTLFSPLGPSRSSLQDLEESEILEDIFFICWRVVMATQVICWNTSTHYYSCALNSAF